MIQTIKQWLYAKKARRLKRAEVEADADAHNREVVSYAARALKAEKRVQALEAELALLKSKVHTHRDPVTGRYVKAG